MHNVFKHFSPVHSGSLSHRNNAKLRIHSYKDRRRSILVNNPDGAPQCSATEKCHTPVRGGTPHRVAVQMVTTQSNMFATQ